MMEWKVISKNECEKIMGNWKSIGEVQADAPSQFIPLRDRLLQIFHSIKEELNIDKVKGREYEFDLRFSLELYLTLNNEFKVSEYEASNDSFWIFLSMKVIPDIVSWRWGIDAESRFFKQSRRIWLKVSWWYIHLSWQGSKEETFQILKDNTTDEVVQLVERSGSSGYRVKLCRQIMRYYGRQPVEIRSRNSNLFRGIMKLNTARLAVIEPALCEGEEEGYVKDLFSRFIANKEGIAVNH